MREQDRPPLLVPATSIYSRTDGVAPWQTCIDEVREHAENIEVHGSHIGMGVNPAVVLAVLDRLGQPEGDWRPFAPPPGLRAWYPRPASWHERREATAAADRFRHRPFRGASCPLSGQTRLSTQIAPRRRQSHGWPVATTTISASPPGWPPRWRRSRSGRRC